MNTKDLNAPEFLAQAAKAIFNARRATGNGLVDDHCVNALKELRSAMNLAVNDSAEEDVPGGRPMGGGRYPEHGVEKNEPL